jgi:DNA-binding NarL/FixJ family response regulator
MIKLKNLKPGKITINFFIIDNDSTFNNRISRELNRDPNYQIHSYNNLQFFLDQYKTKPKQKEEIDLIIINMNLLTGNNTSDVINQVKGTNKSAEIIVLKEEIETDDIPVTLEQGVYSIIKKNENAVFRIENATKGIKSMKSFLAKKRAVINTLIIFFAFSLCILLLLLIFKTHIFEGTIF